MPDTEVVDSPEAPESISTELPGLEDTSIETPESAASETTEDPPAESRNWSHDEWKEHPEFQEWYEEQRYEAELSTHEAAYTSTQETEKRLRGEFVGRAAAGTQALNTFNALAEKAIAIGGEEAFAEALAKHGILDKYNDLAQATQDLKKGVTTLDRSGEMNAAIAWSLGNAMLMSAEAIGDKDMAEPFLKQFARGWKFSEDGKTAHKIADGGAASLIKLAKAIYKKGKDDGFKGGLSTGKDVASEVQKGAERSGKAPPTAAGSVGRGRPTAAQYAAATSEQRSKWADAGIEPLT